MKRIDRRVAPSADSDNPYRAGIAVFPRQNDTAFQLLPFRGWDSLAELGEKYLAWVLLSDDSPGHRGCLGWALAGTRVRLTGADLTGLFSRAGTHPDEPNPIPEAVELRDCLRTSFAPQRDDRIDVDRAARRAAHGGRWRRRPWGAELARPSAPPSIVSGSERPSEGRCAVPIY